MQATVSERPEKCSERCDAALARRVERHPAQCIEALIVHRIELGGAARHGAVTDKLGLPFHNDHSSSEQRLAKASAQTVAENLELEVLRKHDVGNPEHPRGISHNNCHLLWRKLLDNVGRMRGKQRLRRKRANLVDYAFLHMRGKRQFRLFHRENHATPATLRDET